jgi:hypothetical protein
MPALKSYTFVIRLSQSEILKLQKSMSLPTHKNKERKHNNVYSA